MVTPERVRISFPIYAPGYSMLNEFCYLCCTPWKNCDCRHWDKHRLYNRAEEFYNRDHALDEGKVTREVC
ncbi:hypothetical protein F5B20DRAFT_523588 [Whalleya microplaca]|nr:hypothetical protein F5B20DRAFT_523588 [Whalleya microplaca]